MAGNPFRRNHVAKFGDDRVDAPSVSNTLPQKPRKRVVIQSPPPSPEEIPRRRSSGNISPPPPLPEHHDDGNNSDSTATADSELDQATLNTRRNSGSLHPLALPAASASRAPYNPFARTLATSEAAFGLHTVKDDQDEAEHLDGGGVQRTGRPAIDVDAFKNILMTGSAAPSPPVSTPSLRLQESSSGTDVSSISRQSFDPYLEIHPETPRSSFDQVDSSSPSDDDEEGSSLMSGSERLDDFPPPAPPKNTQRKSLTARGPQTVSFADFDESIPSASKTLTTSVPSPTTVEMRQRRVHRSPSDLNKPLPPPPQHNTPPDSSRNVPTRTTSSVDPNSQSKKGAPPPPPASRRAGQATSPQTVGTIPATKRPSLEEAQSQVNPAGSTAKPGSAPPLPPARKSRPLSQDRALANYSLPEATPPAPSDAETKLAPMPPPPPRRNPSKAGTGTSVTRTPSTASHSSSRKETHTQSSHNAPAPPPPRRGGNAKRDSIDGPPSSLTSRRTSENEGRRGSQLSVDSARSHLWTTHSEAVEETTKPVKVNKPADDSSTDILADMNAFQAEIDALRAQAERG